MADSTTSFGTNSSMATGGSTNVAMVGQIAVSDQASSVEQFPVPSSESALETVQRTGTPTAVAEAQAPAAVPNGEFGAHAVATAIPRKVSDERSDGGDRGLAVLLPCQGEALVVPKPRSRSPTPKSEKESASGRSSEHAHQSLQSAPKRHSGRSTPKGAERGENSRPPQRR